MAKGSIGSVLANSVFYTFGNMLLKVFSFFLIPLYTAYLQPDQYGILNLASGFTAVVSCIITMGFQYAVIRFYADLKNDLSKVARMFGTIICSIGGGGIVFLCGLFLFRNYWCSCIFKGIDFYPVIFLAILISFVTSLYSVYQDALKGMQQARKSVLLTYVFFFMILVGNILTVVVLNMGAVGILYAILFVNVIMVGIMFVDLIKHELFVFCIDRKILKDLLKYSLPIVPHSVSYNISSFVTRIIINSKMSVSTLGIFSLASQFGGVADIALSSVQSAFQPWMFNRLNDFYHDTNDAGVALTDIARMSYLLMWVYGLIYIIIGSFAQEAVLLMASESYLSSWLYVPIMVFSIALKSPLYFYNNFLYYNKSKTKFIFITTVIGSVINIFITFWLVPIYGILGSIVADIIAIFVRLFIVIPVVYSDSKSVYSFVKFIVLSIVPMIFMAVAIIPSYSNVESFSWSNILYKILVIFVYIGCVSLVYKEQMKRYMIAFFSHK